MELERWIFSKMKKSIVFGLSNRTQLAQLQSSLANPGFGTSRSNICHDPKSQEEALEKSRLESEIFADTFIKYSRPATQRATVGNVSLDSGVGGFQ